MLHPDLERETCKRFIYIAVFAVSVQHEAIINLSRPVIGNRVTAQFCIQWDDKNTMFVGKPKYEQKNARTLD